VWACSECHWEVEGRMGVHYPERGVRGNAHCGNDDSSLAVVVEVRERIVPFFLWRRRQDHFLYSNLCIGSKFANCCG
jgi:hypothetical protein